MPMKPIQVKANFQLDTSAARAQLQGLQRELSSITKGATMDLGITSQITQAIREAQQLKQILTEATDFSTGAFDLSKFDAAIKQYGTGIKEIKQSLATLGPEGEKAFNSLATTIASAQVPLKRTSQGIQQMMTAFGNTMRWQATSMAMHKIVGTIQQAYSYAKNLDKSLTNIQIVTGHNADYMRNFAREANKAAQALSASTLEYTNASLIYYQQGLSDKEVVKRAETTLKLAKVTGESASKVSQQMTAVWNNFSNGVDNLERYADVMTALGATTASSSSEIAKGLEKFASVTKTIGLSYDYAASALATVTAQTRQSADSVGTAFKTLFSRLESLNLGETLDDSVTLNKYSEALLKVGVNVMDASGKLKNMDNILDELGGKWNNLNKAQQVALAQTVGGVRNYTSLITLMDNWDKFQTNLVTSQLAEGTLQHQADIYAQSWEAAQQRVKTASQGIYDTLISSDFFKGFNNAFAGVLNTINKAGQTLGSVGSTAGIMNLFLAANKDSVAKGIDNFTVNTLGQTSFGQNIFRAQQQAILKDLTSEIYDTGIRSSQIRKDVYQELTNQWDNFRNKTYSSKADYQTNQMMMQQLTTQAQNVMNNAIDMDNLKLQSSIAQRSAAELFAGKFKMGGGITGTVATALGSLFDNQSAQGGYQAGFTEYLQDTFVKNLTKLSGMDLSNASNQAVKALSGQIQAQAQNALKNEALKTVIEGEGKGSPLSTAFNMMSAGNLSKNDITTILENLSSFNTNQIQSYEQLRAKLDQDFLKNNPDAVQKETVRTRVGNRMVPKTQVVRDANGNLVMDENSAAAKEYLARMSDQKEAAIVARKAGYITEQQLEDIKSGNKNLKDVLKPQEEMTTSFGQAAVSTGMMVNSMAMAISSLNNFREQIQNGTVTATGTMTMLGSLGMAAGQMVPVLTNTTKILGTGLSVAGLGGIAALATLGIGATVYGYNVVKAHSLESQISYANESKINAVAQAKEDEQKYEQFLPVMQQQQQAIDKLTSLQQGTHEYTAQLVASNNQAREIIETYNLKAGKDYTVDSNAAIIFTADQIKQTNEDLLKQMQESDMLSQAAISGYTQLTNFQQQKTKKDEILKELQNTFQGGNWLDYYTQEEIYQAYEKYVMDHYGVTKENIQNFQDLQGRSYAEAWFQELRPEGSENLEYWLSKLSEENYLAKPEGITEKLEQLELDQKESELISQGDFQSIINSVLNNTEKTEALQLGAKALGLDSDKLGKYVDFLTDQVYSASGILGWEGESATRNSTGGLKKADQLREIYKKEFGYTARAEIAEDAQALASAIENKRISDWIQRELITASTQFEGQNILSGFLNINDKSYSSMKKIIESVESTKLTDEARKVYDTFTQKALTDSVKAQDNLVQAMMNNQQFQGMQFLEIAKSLQEVEEGANLSTAQLETATNYLNSFTNNFGDAAGKAVFDALTNNQRGWNQDYYEALQKISLDNSISALADLTHFTNLGANADLAEPLSNLRKAILADIDDRGGLAKTLFTSSDFTKVFDSLSEQYKATGEITAQNIADLAKKNEIIGDYMTVTGSNEQVIADMMEMISSGGISAEEITPAIEHFVQRATGAEGAQQEALDVVAEQDLSDSITNMDKWAQNIGKAWYVGRTNNVLGDRPVLEGLKMVLTPADYADFMRTLAIAEHGGTTTSMLNSMKGNMANAYAMLSELEGTGKKRGKGGGGMDTVYEYLAKEGIFDESGIQFDTKTGRFTIGGDKFADTYGQGNEDKLITFSGLKDYIIESLVGSASDGEGGLTGYRFKGQGYTREQAEDLAVMMLGSMSASSMGTYLTAEGLIDAANTFFGELKGEGQQQGNYITPEQYNALFNQYSDVLATMKMERVENEKTGKSEWKLRQATAEEMQTEGFKGVTPLEWRQYFIQEAKKAGSAVIGIKGTTQIGKQDAATIGKAIADASQGTIKATTEKGTDAIVKAAVAAGVQMYQDYNMAQGLGSYIYTDRNKVGQSLDYDQLQNFYNNVLGLSTEILNTHLKEISQDNGGLAFTHKWTDAYGVEHNVNSRDYADTGAFTRAIEQENNFSETILNFQRDQWIADFFTGDHDEAFYNQYGGKNATGAIQYLNDMFAKAQKEAQAAAANTTQSTTSPEGEKIPPEGGEETPPEGEGTTNVTGTTGVVTTPEGAYNVVEPEAQKAVGEYKNYTYRGGPESADVYRYNLLHPTLTPLQAYNAVKYGNVDVNGEWNKKYPSTTPAGKEGSAYWTNQPQGATTGTIYTVDREKAHQQALAKAAAKEGSAYWTSQPPEGRVGTIYTVDREGAHQRVLAKEAERVATKEGSAYWTSQPPEGRVETTYTVDREAGRQRAIEKEIARRAEENAAERAAAKEGSAYWTANTTEIHGPENAELIHWQQRQQLEKEARKAAEKVAAEEKAAREQAALADVNNLINEANKIEPTIFGPNGEVISGPGAEEAARTAMMTPSQYEAYKVQQENIKKAAESLGISTEEASKYINSGFNGSYDAYKQYSNIATFNSDKLSAQQRLDFINATYEKAQKDITSLTPFEKQVLTMIGEIDDNTGTLVEHGEEEGDAATRARNGHQVTEEGEILDENGNPIQFDQNGNPVSSGSGNGTGGDNGGTTGGPGGKSGEPNANEVKAAGGAFVQGLLNGKFGDSNSKTFTFGGQIYSIVRDKNSGVIVGYNPGAEAADSDSGDYVKIDDAAANVDLGGNASGQNNARLLAYASGKKGHIAITGELGPELRVKSDGSMDILGKKGREYAWVDPDDRIYTASQSAGILKSNKIPELEGLAKGINNFIPGYSVGDVRDNPITTDQGSSGSGGGGGGGGGGRSRGGGGAATEKDPRYDPQTLKIRDVIERYYTILQQIDNITKAVERFSKVADRAWGRERIRAIEKQNEMQEKQYEAQKKYIAEIEDYLTTDQAALTTMIQEFVTGWNEAAESKEDMEKLSWTGAEYDENGVLTNYREFVEKLVEQYNQKAASANQKDQYKFQEQLKDIQMYTDTLNLYEEQKDALEDIKNAILDTAIKTISYEVEYKLELSGDADRILNFQADKYKDDVYQAAKYLEFLDQRADLTRQNLISVQDGIFKTLGTYAGEAMRTGAKHSLEELGIYGTDQFKLDEELTDVDEDETEEARIDRLKGISTKVNEWLDQLREKNADAAAEIDKMIEHSEEEGQEDIITNYEEVIRRLNQQIDYTMVRAKVDEWLEELRSKNAEAAAEIDKIVQRNADGEIINYTDVIERLNEENVRLSDEAIALLMEDQDAFFNWMSDFKDNPGWVDFTTEHKDLLTNYMDQIYQYLESLQDTYEQTIEQLGDSIKATSKQMDTAIDEFDYYGDVYKTFGNIVDLTNRHMTDVSKDFFDSLNNRVMDNSINKIKATATNYHLLQKELEEVTRQYNEMQARADAATGEEQIYLQQSADKLKEQLDIANSQYEDAHKAFLSSWEDALSKMAENYKAAVEEASRNFEQGFSPLFNTLALLQAQFDREKALGDLYVDNYQRIHDLSKLNRDIESSILDTDNLKGKERLRDLQKEINDLQADGTELSEYDLDILDKKYKLELARQALEDAKDAKSLVRLARDNNGNWSYVYTANEDDVEKAEQDYEDAIREMEQANEDYIENIQDQIVQVQQEAQQAILALQPEDFATYDDYLAAVQAIQNSMYDTLNFLRSQMNNAFANNEYLDPYIINRYGLNDHDLTTDFEDTTLAKLLDSNNLDQSINHAKDNFENNLLRPALDAYLIYSQKQQEVYEAAEHDMATIGADFGQEMRYVAEMSDNEVQIVEKLSNRVQTAFEDMAAVVDEKTQKHLAEIDELVNKYEKLVEALTEVKRLSGENLPSDMMQAIDTVDTWREIEDLENKLKENGHIRLLEDLVDINREDVIYRSDKLTDATEQIDKWLESLGDSAKEIAETVERNDAGQITNYKDIVQKLSNIEKNDDNKATLKEIKKWKEKDDKAVLMDENQALTEEGLWTYLMAGDEYTKKFLKDKIDNAAKNGAIDVGADVDETEKEKVENYLKAHGIVYVKWDNGLEKFESMDDWLAWYEKHKYVPPSDDGGDYHPPDRGWEYGGSHGGTYWFPTDTGGYTGRWQTESVSMYTGEWPGGSVRRNGRIGLLHQKELVLNAHDTENFLDAMQIVRQLDNLTNWMANGLGDLITPTISDNYGELEQNVHIEAEFPNVQDHNEIEQAFNNLVNMASQYANRK